MTFCLFVLAVAYALFYCVKLAMRNPFLADLIREHLKDKK